MNCQGKRDNMAHPSEHTFNPTLRYPIHGLHSNIYWRCGGIGHARDICPSPRGTSGGRMAQKPCRGTITSHPGRGSTHSTGSQAAINTGRENTCSTIWAASDKRTNDLALDTRIRITTVGNTSSSSPLNTLVAAILGEEGNEPMDKRS